MTSPLGPTATIVSCPAVQGSWTQRRNNRALNGCAARQRVQMQAGATSTLLTFGTQGQILLYCEETKLILRRHSDG